MTDPAPGPGPTSETSPGRTGEIRLGAVIALAVAAALIVWLIVKHDDNDSKPARQAVPEATSPAGLRSFAGTVPMPVYWAGTRPHTTYELTRTDSGNIFVRY